MIKELLLQKGWAGKTISRSETVERMNPLIREFITLNHHYDAFIGSLPTGGFRDALAAAWRAGATLVRVHDVAASADAVRVAAAWRDAAGARRGVAPARARQP